MLGVKYGDLPSFWEIYQDGPWHVHHDQVGGLHLRRHQIPSEVEEPSDDSEDERDLGDLEPQNNN